MTAEDVISIMGLVTGEERGFMRWRRDEVEFSRDDVTVGNFRQRVDQFTQVMTEVLASIPLAPSGYQLSEVTVATEISAKGTISVLGCGGEIGGSGGLTFKFVRANKGTTAE
ncbi:hypothetical protein [Streptomyces natalensis]|uniref:Pepco domain-containing protein n=1 Tax=Streptomyces natalensis TaxID=68242 RepID=UPI00068C0C5D|nr:hypothetical protein [Streptomyces natalensis]